MMAMMTIARLVLLSTLILGGIAAPFSWARGPLEDDQSQRIQRNRKLWHSLSARQREHLRRLHRALIKHAPEERREILEHLRRLPEAERRKLARDFREFRRSPPKSAKICARAIAL